ncbi:BTAD domain-containing putative transcriptional regulator [Actinomadura sp. NPDC047616]|uniref:AfsR/SARP family transcriptional regulator n=1 Tax=Actinomadura sp. NPDC047616 TaxID=3155914 RepID=UPI0033D50D6C
MDFAILGPLQVRENERDVHLGPPKQRALLALLIHHANSVVSMDRLVDELWGDRPPKTAHENLHLYVYQLRRVLGDRRRIRRLESGYQLRIDAGELDADRFADLAAHGQLARAAGDMRRAAALFDEALALWRGAPYADFDRSTTLSGEAARLEERRLTVVEERVAAGLALGRHGELVAELSGLVAEHPLRERFSAQLMVALYRSGRQVEALEVYRAAQRRLADELGLDPGPELRRIHEGILRGTLPDEYWPVVEPRQAVERIPAQLPTDVADFVGRSPQIDMISDLLAPPSPPALPLVAIAGMGGIGKTALAVHVAHRLAAAFPDGQLYANLRGIESSPVEPTAVLGRFLRALGVDPKAIPEDPGERVDVYRSRLAGRRVLVLLDNAADEAQVRPLLPGSSTCAVLITSRTRLTGLEGARLLDLDVLGVEDALELLERIVGSERVAGERDAAVEIARLCGFLPLALRVAAVRLASRPQRPLFRFRGTLADERRRLDELATGDLAVRASLSLSYHGLSAPTRRLLRLLSLLGPIDFAGWVPAALLNVSLDEAESLLDRLVEAQLLGICGAERAGGLRYRLHDLVRVFARELAAGERHDDALARVFGCLLALLEREHRKVYGGDYTTLHGTAPRWTPVDVEEMLAGRPSNWLEAERSTILAAVQQSARMGLHELCWDLATTATTLFEAGGFLEDWSASHQVALAATRAAGNARGEAAVLNSLGALMVFRQSYGEARSHIEKAGAMFAELGERHGHALAQRNLALLDGLAGELETARQRYEQACAALRDVGDRYAEAHAKRGLAQIHMQRGEVGRARACLESALSICRDIGSRRGEAQMLHRLGEAYVEEGRLDAAERVFRQVLDIVVPDGDRVGEVYVRYAMADCTARRGRIGVALTQFTEVLQKSRETKERFVEGCVLLALARLHAGMERYDSALHHADRALAIFRDLATPLWQARALKVLGTALVGAGSQEKARTACTEAHALLDRLRPPDRDHLETRLDALSTTYSACPPHVNARYRPNRATGGGRECSSSAQRPVRLAPNES